MEFTNVVENRRTYRDFESETIPETVISEVVRLAGLAPSVNNSQPWHFLWVQNKEILKEMSLIVADELEEILPKADDDKKRKILEMVKWFSTFFTDVPCVLAVIMKPYEAIVDKILISESSLSHHDINQKRFYPNIQSIAAAIQTLLLAATEKGYSGCWLSGPMVARKKLESILDVNKEDELVAFVALGKPKGKASHKKIKKLDEIFSVLK